MRNEDLSQLFSDLADVEYKSGREWPGHAFVKVSRIIGNLHQKIALEPDLFEETITLEELHSVKGIGDSSFKLIEEFLRTGDCSRWRAARQTLDSSRENTQAVQELCQIPGIGPVAANKLIRDHKVQSIPDLISAVESGRVVLTNAQKIGLEFRAHTDQSRMTPTQHDDIAWPIVEFLRSQKNVEACVAAGSRRRLKETIGDIDIIVGVSLPGRVGRPDVVLNVFNDLELAEIRIIADLCASTLDRVILKGNTKVAGIKNRRQVDFRIVDMIHWGAMLMHATGSGQHNVEMRKRAIGLGYKLNEYGLFYASTQELVASQTEEEIFEKLGMSFIPPEKRNVQ